MAPERTPNQVKFEEHAEKAFPQYFDFRLWPNGQYGDELTRHAFAGYELALANKD